MSNVTVQKNYDHDGEIVLDFDDPTNFGNTIRLSVGEYNALRDAILNEGDIPESPSPLTEPSETDLILIRLEEELEQDDLRTRLSDAEADAQNQRYLVRRLVGIIETLVER